MMMMMVILSSLQTLTRLQMHHISDKLEIPFHLCHTESRSFPGKSGRLVLLSTLRSCVWGDVCCCRHPADLLWSQRRLLFYQTSEKPDRSPVSVRSTWEAEAKKQKKQVALKWTRTTFVSSKRILTLNFSRNSSKLIVPLPSLSIVAKICCALSFPTDTP